jgi:hypothetical protein
MVYGHELNRRLTLFWRQAPLLDGHCLPGNNCRTGVGTSQQPMGGNCAEPTVPVVQEQGWMAGLVLRGHAHSLSYIQKLSICSLSDAGN